MNRNVSEYRQYLADYYRKLENNFNASRAFNWNSPEERLIYQILMSKSQRREKELAKFICDTNRKSHSDSTFPASAHL